MNIEDLSKSQLLLLTVLVNFVTAIATAVLTVSLLAETPTTVIQTVNRIVDHTIETVTQVPVAIGDNAEVPTAEELLVAAIADNAARSVTAYRESSRRDSLGRGVFLPGERAVVIRGESLPPRAHIAFPDGSVVEAERSAEADLLVLYRFSEGVTVPQAPVATLVSYANVKQGQTVIAVAEDGTATTGIVSRVDAAAVLTNLLPIVPPGAEVVNLSGDVVGMNIGNGELIPADRIAALIAPAT